MVWVPLSWVLARCALIGRQLCYVAPVAVPIVFIEAAVYLTMIVISMDFVGVADSTAEWLAASAARDGLDPYSDLRLVSAEYGNPYRSPALSLIGDAPWIHPRLAGGLLALQPFTLLTPGQMFLVVSVCSFVLLAVVAVRYFPDASGWTWVAALGFAAVFAFSAPFLRTIQFGSWGMLFAAVTWWYWSRVRQGEGVLAGVAVGLLGALKIYPLVLLIPALLARRWRTVGSTLVVLVVSNVMGAAVFGIGLMETVTALRSAGEVWLDLPSNASLVPWLISVIELSPIGAALMIFTVGLLGVWMVWRRTGDIDLVVGLTVMVMLLAAPLSWMSNDVILLLPLAIAAGRVSTWWGRIPLAAWFLLSLIPAYHIHSSGVSSLFGRLVLVGMLGVLAFTTGSRPRRPPASPAGEEKPGQPFTRVRPLQVAQNV